ncbi:MAG: RNA pyrophosphohydrolase, partial [Vibrio sp.]|nr:RNA pyrophosphohydrolase [Vibrio sp.]
SFAMPFKERNNKGKRKNKRG